MTTIKDLIEKGYFPAELPPPFTTSKLAAYLPTLVPKLPSYLPSRNRNTNCSRYIPFDIPRVKLQRRNLGIPNPLHQIKLCQGIGDNWTKIQNHFTKSTISNSTPIVGTLSKRAVSPTKVFGDLASERLLKSSGQRVLLKTDISRFYGSIYTHSIPWAIHTKSFAKLNRGNTHYGNVLDTSVRNIQDGQTIGIPIGPDSSLIIAEIIGSALDSELQQEIANLNGFRYIDDYYLYFRNVAEAEIAFSKLTKILSGYELEPNVTKTSITTLPEVLEQPWASELRLFNIRSNVKAQRLDLISYFSKVVEHSIANPKDHVMKYALTHTKAFSINANNWGLFESFLLRTMLDEPSVLPVATEIFLSYENQGYSLNKSKIANTITEIISFHAQYSHTFEVAWALWLSKSLGLSVSASVESSISGVENPIVALIALDLRNSGLISSLDTTRWLALLNDQYVVENQWMLVYEAQVKGWLTGGPGFSASPFFTDLQSGAVEFYDSGLQVNTFTPPTPSVTSGIPNTNVSIASILTTGGGWDFY